MKNVIDYAKSVAKRFPHVKYPPFNSYKLLAHDILGDVEVNHLSYETDEELLDHVENRMDSEEYREAFISFKKRYYAWMCRYRNK